MKNISAFIICVSAAVTLAGCGVRSIHPQKFDRVDQKIVGNRGYLKGTPPPAEDRTGLKRELMAVDVDLGVEESGVSKVVEKMARPAKAAAEEENIK